MNNAFPEQVDKEQIEALFAQLINKFNAESEKLLDHCTKLSLEGEIEDVIGKMFRLDWEETSCVFEILDQLNQVIGFYSELFANKINAVIFSKKLLLRTYATIFEQFTWVIKNCFHKRNAFKKFQPKLLKLENEQMKRRSDTKAFLTVKNTFLKLIERDTRCFEDFLENASFYIPKSNQVRFRGK